MRRLLYIIVVLVLLAVPVRRSDVGSLLPVEAVMVDYKRGKVTITTDTGNVGAGEDLQQAYLDLKENASKQIYLDTADYLILEGDAIQLAEELGDYLKPGIRVCESNGKIDAEEAVQYLAAHTPACRLRDLLDGANTEILSKTSRGFQLRKKVEKSGK